MIKNVFWGVLFLCSFLVRALIWWFSLSCCVCCWSSLLQLRHSAAAAAAANKSLLSLSVCLSLWRNNKLLQNGLFSSCFSHAHHHCIHLGQSSTCLSRTTRNLAGDLLKLFSFINTVEEEEEEVCSFAVLFLLLLLQITDERFLFFLLGSGDLLTKFLFKLRPAAAVTRECGNCINAHSCNSLWYSSVSRQNWHRGLSNQSA